jgi:septum formation protein
MPRRTTVPEEATTCVILASGSRTRRTVLEAAGLEFEVVPSGVDERAIQEALLADDGPIDPADLAEVLARAKAEEVSRRNPEALVIGADQVLALEGEALVKAADFDAAREILLRLRGRTHQLHSAIALAERGDATWTFVDTTHMTMRQFSIEFLGQYLARVGALALDSVGAYQIEGLGIQLFERIDGDYFTILGVPLLPLLAELRSRRIVAT